MLLRLSARLGPHSWDGIKYRFVHGPFQMPFQRPVCCRIRTGSILWQGSDSGRWRSNQCVSFTPSSSRLTDPAVSPRSAIWSSTPSYRGTKPLEKQAVIERITHRDPLLVGHAAVLRFRKTIMRWSSDTVNRQRKNLNCMQMS